MTSQRLDRGKLEIILVDDSETDLEILQRALSCRPIDGFPPPIIRSFTEPETALAELPAENLAVIVCDYHMPGSSGLDWLPDFVRADVGPIIIMTGQGDEEVATEAFRKGASDYLVKSTVLRNPDILQLGIREALRRYRLEHYNNALARQLKIANVELMRNNAKLVELTETAHRFVENVAHEFRTPLAVIRECTSVVLDGLAGEVNDKQRECITLAADATHDLNHLVDDFLDSSKLKAQSLLVDRRPQEVAHVLEQVRPLLVSRASMSKIGVTIEIDGDLPEIFVDAEKIGRIVLNLVINAVKFSSEGSDVRISARRVDDDDVEIAIADQGRGMSVEVLATVFQRFKQAHEQPAAKGFGLGLSIVQELVWLNLGEVGVTSREGEGSTFSFTVPIWDPGRIPFRYVEQVKERYPNCMISTLEAVPGDGDGDLERARRFLASICYPMDLILPAPDARSLLLFGITDEPRDWVEKILHLAHERAEECGALRVSEVGTWSAAAAAEGAAALLASEPASFRAPRSRSAAA